MRQSKYPVSFKRIIDIGPTFELLCISSEAILIQHSKIKEPYKERVLFGIFFMNLAVFIFTVMDGIVKHVSPVFPTGEIVFFRSLFAFIPILLFLMLKGGDVSLRTKNVRGHLVRGIVGVISMYCFFKSYQLLPLSDAIALGLSGPIFITIMSIPLLGEKVGGRRWAAIFVGFLGVLIMTRPGSGVFDAAALVALGGAVLYALAMISIRRLSRTESSLCIVFYFTLFSTCAGLATLPFGWNMPDLQSLITLILIGTLGGCAQVCMTAAYKAAPANLLAPFDYGALVYAMFIGFFWFGEIPDAYLMGGGAVVTLSGLYIIQREAQLARLRHKAPQSVLPTLS